MQPEIETQGEKVGAGWRDHDGFVGPMQPGFGPRSDPRGDFPTGPEVGDRMPVVQCVTAEGDAFNLQTDRDGRPTVFIFFRSAVW